MGNLGIVKLGKLFLLVVVLGFSLEKTCSGQNMPAQNNLSSPEQRWTVQNIPVNEAEWLLRKTLNNYETLRLFVTTDVAKNQIIFSGDDDAVKLAAQTLQAIDKPAVGQPPIQPISQNFPATSMPLQAQQFQSPQVQSQSSLSAPLSAAPLPVPLSAPDPETLAKMEPNEPKSYFCKKSHFANIAKNLQLRYGNNPRMEINIRPETGRILVWAPGSVQNEISQLIKQMDGFEYVPPDRDSRELNGTVLRIVSGPKPVPTPNMPPVQLIHSPQNVTLDTIELKLQTLFGPRMNQLPQTANDTRRFRIAIPRPQGTSSCDLEFNATEFRVKISGSPNLSEQFLRLIEDIDQPSPKVGHERRYISIQNSDPEKIRKLLETYQMKMTNPSGRRGVGNDIRQVAYLNQDEGGGIPAPLPAMTPSTMVPSTVPSGIPGGGESLNNMGGYPGTGFGFGSDGTQMELIPDLRTDLGMNKIQVLEQIDVVIIDAPGAEVARIMKMIKDLEEISREAEPKLEVVFLKNVQCLSLYGVIQQQAFSQQIFNAKQGRVWIFPLANPNAILVAGWGAALDTMKDVIELLDQPVSTENSMIRVIRLQSVSAEYVAGMIEQFFGQPFSPYLPTDFTPRVRVMSDARSNSLIIHAAPNDYREIERIISELDVTSGGPRLRVKVIKLTNILARDMATMMQSALQPGIQGTSDNKLPTIEILSQTPGAKKIIESGYLTDVVFSPNSSNNTLVVTAPENSMELIAEMIKILDVPSSVAEFKVIPIEYSDATTIRKTLEELLPTQLAGTGGPQLPGAEGEESFTPVRMSVDTRSNSLLVAGSRGDLTVIKALVMRLDQPDAMERTTETIVVKNQSATDIANAINRYALERRTFQKNNVVIVSPYQQLESEVVAIPEPVSNKLIINVAKAYRAEIIKLIEDLDKEPLQVVIQVMIGEVTLSNTDEFGIELGLQDPILYNRSLLNNIQKGTRTTTTKDAAGNTITTTEDTIISASNTPGFNWNPPTEFPNSGSDIARGGAGIVAGQALTNFATGRANSELGFGGLVLSASSDAVSILLRALQETGRFEVLSRPQVTAQDNQLALIFVGQEVSRVGGTAMTAVGAASNVDSKNIGLLLGVVPRISPDGKKVVMLISAEKSSLGAISDGIPIPTISGDTVRSPNINQIRAETIISATDGETVMLGGLITRNHQTVNRRVPYISDIPILGNLFRYDFESCKRTELILIMRPRIVRNKNDMAEIKRVEFARMHWCLADVVNIHGDIDTYTATQDIPVTGNAPIEEPGYVSSDELQVSPLPPSRTSSSSSGNSKIPTPTLAAPKGADLRSESFKQETILPAIDELN